MIFLGHRKIGGDKKVLAQGTERVVWVLDVRGPSLWPTE